MANLDITLPFVDRPGECLSIGNAPSQGLVFSLDKDIVVKLPFQYRIPNDLDKNAVPYLNHTFRSFIAMERELAVYDALAKKPNANVARRLKADSSTCLFLERLYPLESKWVESNETMRQRWVRELLAVICCLEEIGFTHGDIAIRNLALDSSDRLKLFDFGSTTTKQHYDYAADVKRDHSGLATCLHYILCGIDPFANAHSVQEVRQLASQLLEGRGTIGAGAEILIDVIQDGWTGKAASTKFSQVRARVEALICPSNPESVSEIPEKYYTLLESRCAEWLKRATPDPRWMSAEDYSAACIARGYEADMDIWR